MSAHATFKGSSTVHATTVHAGPPRIVTVGLGDLIATFAKPIASAIDAATEQFLTPEHHTALASCGACARRQKKGNLICPDIATCPVLAQLLGLLPAPIRDALMEAAAKRLLPPEL